MRMPDLGVALLWLAVQDAVLVLAVAWVQARVGRTSPAAGASVAAFGLGLVLVLPLGLVWPRSETTKGAEPSAPVVAAPERPRPAANNPNPTAEPSPRSSPAGWSRLPGLAWSGVERRFSPAVDRWRPAAGWLVPAVAVVVALGLVRLAGGLVAVAVWRRRGRAVVDDATTADLDALRAALGVRRSVAVREVAGLGSPALAGWWRPVLFLPRGWRTWPDGDRRAVIAHELAHAARGDYAAGLLAHLTRAIHAHHPAVVWLAARLVRDQEAAADGRAAEAVGGRAAYRMALARLALRLDDEDATRSPGWLARAFLPRRSGALIRRIAMLTQEDVSMNRRNRPRTRLAALALAALALAVGSVRAPVRADTPTATPPPLDPTPVCLGDNLDGVFAVRPAALIGRVGSEPLAQFVDTMIGDIFGDLADSVQVEATGAKAGSVKIPAKRIDWISVGFRFDQGSKPDAPPAERLHRVVFEGVVIRTVAPFDWLGYLAKWGFQPTEVAAFGRVYHRGTVQGVAFAVHQPDDRSLIFGSEKEVRTVIDPAAKRPPLLEGPDWDQARQGVMAVALANPDNRLTKNYNLGRPDDAAVLALVQGVERWTVHASDTDPMDLHAIGRAAGEPAALRVVAAVAAGRLLGLQAMKGSETSEESSDRIAWAVLNHLRVHQDGGVARVDVSGADLIAQLVRAGQQFEEFQNTVRQVNAQTDELKRLSNTPELKAARERYPIELKAYEEKEAKYRQELEKFRAGKRDFEPLKPVPPVQPPPAWPD